MSGGLDSSPGSTLLDHKEAADLIPGHITTAGQLNEWEAANILRGVEWAFQRRQPNVATEDFVKALHHRMFDQTWRWAGRYRTTGKNLGSPTHLIPIHVREACANAQYWVAHKVFAPTELAARFHHQIVAVHPFPNGNGRHARLLADVLLASIGEPELTWGQMNFQQAGSARDEYIRALQEADRGDFEDLIQLARA